MKVDMPKVDSGKIYPEITKFIQNENFVFDMNELLTVEELQSLVKDTVFVKKILCS